MKEEDPVEYEVDGNDQPLKGLAIYEEYSAEQILYYAEQILKAKVKKADDLMTKPEAVGAYLKTRLATAEKEYFGLIYLDNRHRLIDDEEVAEGTIDGASVYPREIVKACLHHNAAAVILYHNHPSGDVAPSMADQRITNKLHEALALVEVRVLDHFVVGVEGWTSFAQRGLL